MATSSCIRHVCARLALAIAIVFVLLLAESIAASSSSSTQYERRPSGRGHRNSDAFTRGRSRSRGRWDRGGNVKDERSRPSRTHVASSSSSSSSSFSASSSASLPEFGSGAPVSPASSGRARQQRRNRGRARSDKPNIVVILTDDQDVLLGSLGYMPKLQRLLIRQGALLNNSFVSTPMCCPSRSTFLSGLYVHNHNVYSNNVNCSGQEWQSRHEPRAFPNYINSTYRTGYFGKYLNDYFGDHTPPGWHRWMGLIRNSRFYNYSLIDETGRLEKHGDNYYNDYLTDLVARRGTAWLRESKMTRPTDPVMMVLSVPAPHGPEDAAPQYQHMFVNNTDHRTPAWNYAPNPDKQWLLQYKSPMTPQFKIFTDLLQRRRLQTLQSVDDMVEMVVKELDRLGELDNTYIVYTSDHGYHLGQFGLIKGKAMPFDFDTRVPLIVRGPGIQPGINISNIVVNADMAPTFIDMAGQAVPDHMDGQSIMRLLRAARDPKNVDERGFVQLKKPWKDSILFERGKLTDKILRQRERTEEMIIFNQAQHNKEVHFYIPTRRRKLAIECSKPTNRLPCKPQQKWYCIEVNGRLRKHKCRNSTNASAATIQRDQPRRYHSCPCVPLKADGGGRRGKKLSRAQRRRQRRRNKRHLGRGHASKFMRSRRSVRDSEEETQSQSVPVEFSGLESLFDRRCRILSNETVVCDLDIYEKPHEWATHKEKIDAMIREYRKALDDLRDIRRHLRKQRPIIDSADEDESPGGKQGAGDAGTKGSYSDHRRPQAGGGCLCDEDGKIIARGKGNGNSKVTMPAGLSKSERRDMRRQIRRNQRTQRKRRRNKSTCNTENMNCFTHDNHHWKTPPYWNYGPFCFCSNANNNTYWCLRTINTTHDFLYCEFITTFMSFYDLLTDPHQLKNTVTELNYGVLQQLHEELELMKTCKGRQECTLRGNANRRRRLQHRPDWPGLITIRRSKARRHRYIDNRWGSRRASRSGWEEEEEESYHDEDEDFKTAGYHDEAGEEEHDIGHESEGIDSVGEFDETGTKWDLDYE